MTPMFFIGGVVAGRWIKVEQPPAPKVKIPISEKFDISYINTEGKCVGSQPNDLYYLRKISVNNEEQDGLYVYIHPNVEKVGIIKYLLGAYEQNIKELS